jgi:Arc/MetJ family transcription regulator
VATNLEINQELLEQAKALSGLGSKRETVNQALHEFVQSRLKQQLLDLRGKIEYFEDYDYKAVRKKR